jgi:hypothetical protein
LENRAASPRGLPTICIPTGSPFEVNPQGIPGPEWNKKIDPERASRAVNEYLATLDDAAHGAATPVVPKFISPSDPAAQWTGAMKSTAFFAYADNYLIDVKPGSSWMSKLRVRFAKPRSARRGR